MSKYIPPNQRGSVFSSESNQRDSSESNPNESSVSRRWKRDDLQEPGFLQSSRHVQHTSNAADVVEQMSKVKLDDFPALPTKKPITVNNNAPSVNGRASYASLASNWAEKAKENEEKAKKEAEDEMKKRKAKMDMKVIPIRQSLVAKKRKDSDDDLELDIGCYTNNEVELSDPSEVEYELEEEDDDDEVEEDPDAFWTQRKHKGDMY